MNNSTASSGARRLHEKLLSWLLQDAYPLWASQGFDPEHGAFNEKLTAAGPVLHVPRRARVQTRQIYAYSQAPGLGWTGQVEAPVTSALGFFVRHYRRPDNLFSTLVHHDGRLADERADLYDQAFALLALASCQEVLGPRAEIVDMGVGLRGTLLSKLRRPGGGFDSGPDEPPPLRSNPHMHLFEAALAWTQVSDDPGWRALADELGELALSRIINPKSGAIYELFDAQWRPLPAGEGQAIEPGHQFEWAWLLLNFDSSPGSRARQAAERLYEIGASHGVNADGIVINALKDDFSVQDGAARLWPHTEWLKAAARLGRLTNDARYWKDAERAASALLRFLQDRAPGLWWDKITADGKWVEEAAPASSFYHIICAISELGTQLK